MGGCWKKESIGWWAYEFWFGARFLPREYIRVRIFEYSDDDWLLTVDVRVKCVNGRSAGEDFIFLKIYVIF